MFNSPDRLLLGLLTGMVFGVLLQKGQVAKFSVSVGQCILKDWTVVKIMGPAVLVGSVGVYALVASGHAELHVKPFLLAGRSTSWPHGRLFSLSSKVLATWARFPSPTQPALRRGCGSPDCSLLASPRSSFLFAGVINRRIKTSNRVWRTRRFLGVNVGYLGLPVFRGGLRFVLGSVRSKFGTIAGV